MNRVLHTGITVSNLDQAITFYRDVLGLKLKTGPSEFVGGEERSRAVGVPGAWYRGAVLETEDGALELQEYKAPPSPVDRPMPLNTLGAHHVCFLVDNIDAKVAELEAKGVQFLAPVRTVTEGPFKGYRWAYFRDPDGIAMELVEYTPQGEG